MQKQEMQKQEMQNQEMWLEYFSRYLGTAFPKFLEEKPWNYKDDLCVIGHLNLHFQYLLHISQTLFLNNLHNRPL